MEMVKALQILFCICAGYSLVAGIIILICNTIENIKKYYNRNISEIKYESFDKVLEELKKGINPTNINQSQVKEKYNTYIFLLLDKDISEKKMKKKIRNIINNNPSIYEITNAQDLNNKWFIISSVKDFDRKEIYEDDY